MKRTPLERARRPALPASATAAPYTLEVSEDAKPPEKHSVVRCRAKALKRGEPLDRRSELKRSTRLRVLGRRGHEARKALAGVRLEVLERAGWRCERCGAVAALDLHHRLPRSRGGKHTAENLLALCSGPSGCHAKVTDHLVDDWADWIETRGGVA